MVSAKDIVRKEFLKADKGETLTAVNSRIKNEAFSEVLIFDKKELIGIFSPSRASMIFPTKKNMENMKIENLVKSINPLDEETDFHELMIKILGTGYNLVPISKKGQIIGIVHIFDILDAIKVEELKVSDIELHKPVELLENEKIEKAIKILYDDINNTILIRDKDNNPVAILNHYDLLRNLKLDSYKQDDTFRREKSERENMLAFPISKFIKDKQYSIVSKNDKIPKVIEEFKKNGVLSLIVENLSSLIKSKDILRYIVEKEIIKIQNVYFVGLEEINIDNFTTTSLKSSVHNYFEKIKSILQQDAILKVHIKRRHAAHEDTRHEYSVDLHLEFSSNYISIKNVTGWNLEEILKSAMDKLETRVNRLIKSHSSQARDSVE